MQPLHMSGTKAPRLLMTPSQEQRQGTMDKTLTGRGSVTQRSRYLHTVSRYYDYDYGGCCSVDGSTTPLNPGEPDSHCLVNRTQQPSTMKGRFKILVDDSNLSQSTTSLATPLCIIRASRSTPMARHSGCRNSNGPHRSKIGAKSAFSQGEYHDKASQVVSGFAGYHACSAHVRVQGAYDTDSCLRELRTSPNRGMVRTEGK